MATQKERKKRGLFILLGIVALLLLAAFAAPWLQTWWAVSKRWPLRVGVLKFLQPAAIEQELAPAAKATAASWASSVWMHPLPPGGQGVDAPANDEGVEVSD